MILVEMGLGFITGIAEYFHLTADQAELSTGTTSVFS